MLLLVRKFDAENFAEDKPYDINIEVIKSPQTENKIEEKDRIFLPPKKKEILLLKVNNDELSIGVDQASLKNKNIGNLVENKENDIYIEGKKIDNIGIIRRGIIFENLEKNQNSIFIPAGKKEEKEPLLEDKIDDLNIEGTEENVRPQTIRQNNQISNQNKIFIRSKKKEPLLCQIDSNNINIEYINPKKREKSSKNNREYITY